MNKGAPIQAPCHEVLLAGGTEGREASLQMRTREHQYYKILSLIENRNSVTQRLISTELGIALGLTNRLIGRLIEKGFLETKKAVQGRRLRYLLTSEGLAEQARLSAAYLENTILLYTETRERIRERLGEMAAFEPQPFQRIVFYGAGEVAEIAYITLDNSRSRLVGIVDDCKQGQKFFGHTIGSPRDLVKRESGLGWDKVFVTALRRAGEIHQQLKRLKIPEDRIASLWAPSRGRQPRNSL